MNARRLPRAVLYVAALCIVAFATSALSVRLLGMRGDTPGHDPAHEDVAAVPSPATTGVARDDLQRRERNRLTPSPIVPTDEAELTTEVLAYLVPERDSLASKLSAEVAAYHAAESAEAAAAVMNRIITLHMSYVTYGGDERFLPFLRTVADHGASWDARRFAVISVHRMRRKPFVDFLLDLTSSSYPEVRFYAVEGLAWVSGTERSRATEGLVKALDSPDKEVRKIAATMLGVVVKDAAHVERLLAHLPGEDDEGAAESYVRAVVRLDPEEGPRRAMASVERTGAGKQRAVRAVLDELAVR